MILDVENKSSHIHITSKITSQQWVSIFYKVDDTAVSIVTRNQQKKWSKSFAFSPYAYQIKLHEGENTLQKEVRFDYVKRSIGSVDYSSNVKATFILKDLIFDPLSALYYLRNVPMTVGKSIFVKVFSNTLVYTVEVQVLRKEKLETAFGTVDTVVVRSNMNSIGDGIFYKPGDVYIWFTDDEKRIPVLIEKRINELVEGKIPTSLENKIPVVLKERIKTGSIKAHLVRK